MANKKNETGFNRRRAAASEKTKEAELSTALLATPPKPILYPRASRLWDELAPKLVKAGMICELDDIWLAEYCDAKSRMLDIYEEEQKITAALKAKRNSNGSETLPSNSKILAQLQKRVEKAAMLMGLAEGRKKIVLVPEAKADGPAKGSIADIASR